MYMSTNTLTQLIIHALILPIIEMRNENKKMALDIENISKKEFEMSVVKLEKTIQELNDELKQTIDNIKNMINYDKFFDI